MLFSGLVLTHHATQGWQRIVLLPSKILVLPVPHFDRSLMCRQTGHLKVLNYLACLTARWRGGSVLATETKLNLGQGLVKKS
jgi:hypothetical protein